MLPDEIIGIIGLSSARVSNGGSWVVSLEAGGAGVARSSAKMTPNARSLALEIYRTSRPLQ
jgi:hypothetical protein